MELTTTGEILELLSLKRGDNRTQLQREVA